jgi:hypothetical protein
MGKNSGCKFVTNNTDKALYIVDGEDPRYTLLVQAGGQNDFKGVQFPWCKSTDQVKKKAFRVYEGTSQNGTLLFYIFQDDATSQNCYTGPDANWSGKHWLADQHMAWMSLWFKEGRVFGKEPPPSGLWNTGCEAVTNQRNNHIYIVDGEDPGYTLLVPARDRRTWTPPRYPLGVVFPFCSTTDEVKRKAFRVYDGNSDKSKLLFYIFQDHKTKLINYTGPDANWNGRQTLREKPEPKISLWLQDRPFGLEPPPPPIIEPGPDPNLTLQVLYERLKADLKGYDGQLYGLTQHNNMTKAKHDDWLDTPSDSWNVSSGFVTPSATSGLMTAMGGAIEGAKHLVDIVGMEDLFGWRHPAGVPRPGFIDTINKSMVKLSGSGGDPVVIRVLLGNTPRSNIKLDFLSHALMKDVKKPSENNRRIILFIGVINYKSNQGWNHAKIIAIDGHTLITGGHNLWDKHYLGQYPVFDLSLRVRGPVAGAAHTFASRMWEFVQKHNTHGGGQTDRTYFISTDSEDSSRVRDKQPPSPLDPSYPASPSSGDLPVLWVANPGVGIFDTNGSADRKAMFHSMMRGTTLRLVQQDLGATPRLGLQIIPPRVEGRHAFEGVPFVWWTGDLQPDQEHRFEIATIAADRLFDCQFSTFDAEFMGHLVDFLMRKDTRAEIVLTNLDAKAEEGTSYSNGVRSENFVRLLFMMGMKKGLTKELIRDKLSLRTIAINGGRNRWANNHEIAQHSKFWMVDGRVFYVGSQNVYPTSGIPDLKINAFLQEFGVIIDNSEIVNTVVKPFWLDPLLKNATPNLDIMKALS